MGDKRGSGTHRRGDQQGMNFTIRMSITVFDEKGPCDKRRTRIESFAIESALTVLEEAAIESISCERVGCCKKKGFGSICRKKRYMPEQQEGCLFDVALAVLPAYLLLDLGSLKYPWEQQSANYTDSPTWDLWLFDRIGYAREKRRKGQYQVDWTNESFPSSLDIQLPLKRKKRFGLVKIELVAE